MSEYNEHAHEARKTEFISHLERLKSSLTQDATLQAIDTAELARHLSSEIIDVWNTYRRSLEHVHSLLQTFDPTVASEDAYHELQEVYSQAKIVSKACKAALMQGGVEESVATFYAWMNNRLQTLMLVDVRDKRAFVTYLSDTKSAVERDYTNICR